MRFKIKYCTLDMSKTSFFFLFVLVSLKHAHANPFQPVTETCKYWDPVSVLRNGEKVKLHCILDENGQLGIVNATWKLLTEGRCPYFNRLTDAMDSFACNKSDGSCPPTDIRSYQATQCCLKETKKYKQPESTKKTNECVCNLRVDKTKMSNDSVCSHPIQQILLVLINVILLVMLVGNVIYYRLKTPNKSPKERPQSTWRHRTNKEKNRKSEDSESESQHSEGKALIRPEEEDKEKTETCKESKSKYSEYKELKYPEEEEDTETTEICKGNQANDSKLKSVDRSLIPQAEASNDMYIIHQDSSSKKKMKPRKSL